jgi:hypothetical protein
MNPDFTTTALDAEFLRYVTANVPVPPERVAEFAAWASDFEARMTAQGVVIPAGYLKVPSPGPQTASPVTGRTVTTNLQPGVIEFRFAAQPERLEALRDALVDLPCPSVTCDWPDGPSYDHTPGCAIETTIRLWDFVLSPLRCGVGSCTTRITPGAGHCKNHGIECRTCRGAGKVSKRGGQAGRRNRKQKMERCALCMGTGRIPSIIAPYL